MKIIHNLGIDFLLYIFFTKSLIQSLLHSKEITIPLEYSISEPLSIIQFDKIDNPNVISFYYQDSQNKIIYNYDPSKAKFVENKEIPSFLSSVVLIKKYILKAAPIYLYYDSDDSTSNKIIKIKYDENTFIFDTKIDYSWINSIENFGFVEVNGDSFVITISYTETTTNKVSMMYLDTKDNTVSKKSAVKSNYNYVQCFYSSEKEKLLCLFEKSSDSSLEYSLISPDSIETSTSTKSLGSIIITSKEMRIIKHPTNANSMVVCIILNDGITVNCYDKEIEEPIIFQDSNVFYTNTISSTLRNMRLFYLGTDLNLLLFESTSASRHYEIYTITKKQTTEDGILYAKSYSLSEQEYYFHYFANNYIYMFYTNSTNSLTMTVSEILETIIVKAEMNQSTLFSIDRRIYASQTIPITSKFINIPSSSVLIVGNPQEANQFFVTGTEINNFEMYYYFDLTNDNGKYYYKLLLNIYPEYCSEPDETGLQCIKCKTGSILDSTDGRCYNKDNVKDGYYWDDDLKKIVQCDVGCYKCKKIKIGLSECLECKENYFLKRNRCNTTCGDGYYSYRKECFTECPQGTIGVHNEDSGDKCISYEEEKEYYLLENKEKISEYDNISDITKKKEYLKDLTKMINEEVETNKTKLFLNVILFNQLYNKMLTDSEIGQYITPDIITKMIDKFSKEISLQKVSELEHSQLILIIESFIQFMNNLLSLTNDNFKTVQQFYKTYLQAILDSDIISDSLISAIIQANNKFLSIAINNNIEASTALNETLIKTSPDYLYNHSLFQNENNSIVMELIDINMKMVIKKNAKDSSYNSQSYNILSFPFKRANYSEDIVDYSINLSVSFYDSTSEIKPGEVLKIMKKEKIQNKLFFPTKSKDSFSSIGLIKYESYPYLNPQVKQNVSDSFYTIKLYSQEISEVKVNNTEEPIKIVLSKQNSNHQCVFFDERIKKLNNEGCTSEVLNDYIICTCNHLTDFSIADFNPGTFLYPDVDQTGVFVDRRIINNFEPFSILNAKNSVIVYIYIFMFVMYIIILTYSICQDMKGVKGSGLILEEDDFTRDERVVIYKNSIDDRIDELKENIQVRKKSNITPKSDTAAMERSRTGFQLKNSLIEGRNGTADTIMIEMQNKGNSTTNTLSKRNRTTLPQFFQNANLYFTTSPSSNQCFLPFKLIWIELFKNEYKLTSFVLGSSFTISRVNQVTVLLLRTVLQITICSFITKVHSLSEPIRIGHTFKTATISLLIAHCITFLFEIALSKVRIKKSNDIVKVNLLKYKKVFCFIIVYCFVSLIIFLCVANSIWVGLYMELNSRKIYLWADSLICFGLDHIVFESIIITAKAGIIVRLIKIDNSECTEYRVLKRSIFSLSEVFILYSLYES